MAESFASSSTWAGPVRPPTASPLRVAFKTLGCKVNQVEAADIARDLVGRGCDVVADDLAELVVVNTCTVTAEADHKARKAVRHALDLPTEPLVLVTGCLAAIDAPALAALGDRVVVESDKSAIPALIADKFALERATTTDDAGHGSALCSPDSRTRAFVKIEDGCDAFCAYCIVPYARGVPRSVPLPEVVRRVRGLVANGTNEIVLTGINIGRYYHDGADLADVLAAVGATGVPRVRLSSIEPPDLTSRLLEALAASSATCAHLHVPLQSGSDAVLKAMGRTYTIAEYEARITAARSAIPGLAVSTDVIAGFPGETAEEADDTRRACERIGFSRLHVFRYSRRTGTPAAERSDQVLAAEIAARASALRGIGRELQEDFARRLIGRVVEVLVERTVDDGEGSFAEGTSREYQRVRMPAQGARPGELVRARVESAKGDLVVGTPVGAA